MKTFIKKLQHNNKGMSLIEILVTLAIISLIAAPLINSFLTAMRTNEEARLIQNATSVGQDVAEQFKVFEVEDMYAKYTNADDESNKGITVTEEDGVYKFAGITREGANGEDFVVDITLNPAVYSGGTGAVKDQVNNVEMPAFSGLHGSDSIVIQVEYSKYDDQLKGLFANSLPNDILENIYQPEYRKNVSKETDIYIKNTLNAEGGYTCTINMDINYYYSDGIINEEAHGVSQLIKEFDKDEFQSIYMICPVFDKYTVTGYSTDKINVEYEYVGVTGEEPDVYFYIAEQETKNLTNGNPQRINPLNLSFKNEFGDYIGYGLYYDELKKDMAKIKVNQTMDFKMLTNIGDADTDPNLSGELHDLTEGDYNTGTALYEMLVEVKYKDKSITKFTTAR